jgi:PTH2 family peptidyl-tRNA hydrolase
VRGDLEMTPGKMSSQAGHGYTETLFVCHEQRPELYERYRHKINAGSKATLIAPHEDALLKAAKRCEAAGIPYALFYDEGHVMLPHFDGNPILTALGIGPVSRKDAKPIVSKFKLA